MNTSAVNLNNHINKIRNWTINWKMSFNLDSSKQAPEVIFSRKLQNTNHNQVYFNHNSMKQVSSQKHLGIYLDTKLKFQFQITIGLLHTLQVFLPRQSLVTV